MNFRSRMKVVPSLENLENTGGGEAELVPAAAAEVEAGAAEISENIGEVESLEVAVEDALNDIDTLGEYQDIMEESVSSGEGLSEQAAEVAEVAIESILNRLGFSEKQSVIPSLESFGQKGSRLASTKISLENLGEKMKKAGQGVLNFLKQIWEKIKGFFAGLFRSRDAMKKQLDSLLKRAEASDKAAKLSEETLSGGIAKAFSIDGKADEGTAKVILENSRQLAGIAGALSSVVVAAVNSEGTVGEFGEKIKAGISGSLKSVTGGNDGEALFGNLVGGRAVAVTADPKATDGTFKLSFVDAGKKADKIKALNATETIALIKDAQATLNTLVKLDKVQKDLDSAAKHAVSTIEKLMAAGGKSGDDKEAEKKAKDGINAIRAIANTTSKLGMGMPGLIFASVKAAADYASASLNNLKGEDAPKKDDDKK